MQKVCLLNLGCKVNQYEIDGILNSLKDNYEVTTKLEVADIYIVNTCAVTQEAERKSRQEISKIIKINENAKIYVCGCASQHNQEQFMNRPQVKYIIGTQGKGDIKNNFDKCGNYTQEISKTYEDDITTTNVRTRGYVKIQDGCNNYCSYCLIPYVRGFSRSRPLLSVLNEATELSKSCNEIVITGINISDYKIDNRLSLDEVLLSLKNLPARLRLGSIEVNIITEEFLKKISSVKNFCPQFHLSLQNGSDKVLKDINRHYTTSEYLDKVNLIRKYYNNSAITTDLIVGYPTETEEEFEKSKEFIKKVDFSSVHYFAYSLRPGTRASKLPQINGKEIKRREHELKPIVEQMKINYLNKFINCDIELLVEEKKNGFYEGFSREYLRLYLKSDKSLIGKLIKVRGINLYKDGLLVEESV